MRGEPESGARGHPTSPSRITNGSSSSHKASLSNVLTSSDGQRITHTNGHTAANARSSQRTFYGHDREEVTRILIQGLSDLGYDNAAGELSRESGYDLETPYAAAFRAAVLHGDWAEAETLLFGEDRSDESEVNVVAREPTAPEQHSYGTGNSSGSLRNRALALAEDSDKNEILFMIRQQKYLELLEMRDQISALTVLQQELQPLHQDARQLHALTSLIMCRNSDDLKAQANWDGALGESRRVLLSRLSRFISPSVMIPEHRLAELLTQVRTTQILDCPYHNTMEWPSLYTDHNCERDDFPLNAVYELDRHSDEVWFLQFSNDGTRLATAGKDGIVMIYETTNFRLEHTLSDHDDSVAYVAWSPDDRTLISCSHDKSARLWDTRTGMCLRTINFHTEQPVTTAAWAPDGRTFVTGSLALSSPLCIWSFDGSNNSLPLHNFTNSCSRVQDCDIAALTRSPHMLQLPPSEENAESTTTPIRLVAICIDKSIQVFDYARREKLSHITLDFEITCLNLSCDGQEMLVNLSCDEVWALSVEDGEIRQKFRGQKQGGFVIRSCFGGAREGFVVSGGEDHRICIWHRQSGRLIEQLEAHLAGSGCVNAVAWNKARPAMFASAGDDHKVMVYTKPYASSSDNALTQTQDQLVLHQDDSTGRSSLHQWGSAAGNGHGRTESELSSGAAVSRR